MQIHLSKLYKLRISVTRFVNNLIQRIRNSDDDDNHFNNALLIH